MQQIYAWLDLGDGLQPLNDHTRDVAVLDSLSIQWGTDTLGRQPDPAVCSFTLVDHTGSLSGDFIRLAGARLVLTMSREPQWRDLAQYGAWEDCDFPIGELATRYRPDTVDASGSVSLFDGIIASGGSIERHGDHWHLVLSASSRMLIWKRLQKQGPVSGAANLAGMHWTGTPEQRLTELNKRAQAAGAPIADASGLGLPAACAPYDANTYPSQLDLLHRLYAHSPLMPIWHEHTDGMTTVIAHTDLAAPSTLTIDANATVHTTGPDGTTRPAIASKDIKVDDDVTLTINEPLTGVTVQGKTCETDDDGKLAFNQAESTYTAPSLPGNLTATQNTITMESDAILASDSTAYPAWTPDATGRDDVQRWILAQDKIAAPDTITFDSRRIDPSAFPWLYRPEPSGPIFAEGPVFAELTASDGSPTASSIWTTIAGTFTFQWVGETPVLRNECSIVPLPGIGFNQPTWDMIADWPAIWSMTALTWAQTMLISQYLSTPLSTESEEQ